MRLELEGNDKHLLVVLVVVLGGLVMVLVCNDYGATFLIKIQAAVS